MYCNDGVNHAAIPLHFYGLNSMSKMLDEFHDHHAKRESSICSNDLRNIANIIPTSSKCQGRIGEPTLRLGDKASLIRFNDFSELSKCFHHLQSAKHGRCILLHVPI